VGIIHQRRKAETRALLVAAGLELFAERGFEIATLDEVAAMVVPPEMKNGVRWLALRLTRGELSGCRVGRI